MSEDRNEGQPKEAAIQKNLGENLVGHNSLDGGPDSGEVPQGPWMFSPATPEPPAQGDGSQPAGSQGGGSGTDQGGE